MDSVRDHRGKGGSGLLLDAGLLLVLGDWQRLSGCGEAHMEGILAPQQLSCSLCDAPAPREIPFLTFRYSSCLGVWDWFSLEGPA